MFSLSHFKLWEVLSVGVFRCVIVRRPPHRNDKQRKKCILVSWLREDSSATERNDSREPSGWMFVISCNRWRRTAANLEQKKSGLNEERHDLLYAPLCCYLFCLQFTSRGHKPRCQYITKSKILSWLINGRFLMWWCLDWLDCLFFFKFSYTFRKITLNCLCKNHICFASFPLTCFSAKLGASWRP